MPLTLSDFETIIVPRTILNITVQTAEIGTTADIPAGFIDALAGFYSGENWYTRNLQSVSTNGGVGLSVACGIYGAVLDTSKSGAFSIGRYYIPSVNGLFTVQLPEEIGTSMKLFLICTKQDGRELPDIAIRHVDGVYALEALGNNTCSLYVDVIGE
jgi:hypothetical protein